MLYKGNSFKELFEQLRVALLLAPEVEIRSGVKTKELLSVQLELSNPRSRLIYHPKRKYNIAFNLAEVLCYVSGINSVEFLSLFNSNISNFSDDGITFYGNYGQRLAPYYRELIKKLSEKNSRQAVMTIYHSQDMFVETKDVPCTVAFDFKLRDGKLHMHTFMRSNDLIWGLQYDLFAFTYLQEIIANQLKVDVGNYYHTAASMHVYNHHYGLLEKMETVEEVECEPHHETIASIDNLAHECKRLEYDRSYFLYHPIFLVLFYHLNGKYDVSNDSILREMVKEVKQNVPLYTRKFLGLEDK